MSLSDGDRELVSAELGRDPTTAEAALYNMTVDLFYRTAELDYRSKIEIEPGDHDG